MTRNLVENIFDVALPQSVDVGTPIAGPVPAARILSLGQLGSAELGVWQIGEGQVADVESDEMFVVIQGQGELRFQDGTNIALKPGVVVRLAEGDRTEWIITESLRKIYFTTA